MKAEKRKSREAEKQNQESIEPGTHEKIQNLPQKKTKINSPPKNNPIQLLGIPHDYGYYGNSPCSTSGSARVARCNPPSALKFDGRPPGPRPTKLGSSCAQFANLGRKKWGKNRGKHGEMVMVCFFLWDLMWRFCQ